MLIMNPENTNQNYNSDQTNTPQSGGTPDNTAPIAQAIETPVQPAPEPAYLATNNANLQEPTPPTSHKLSERSEKLKKLSIQVMIGGLIGAAVVAVVAVLAGSFSETFAKALFTLLLVMVHALACLAYVEQTGKTQDRNFRFFENTVFTLIVLSFFTSILGVWSVLEGSVVAKLYGTYFILFFACLHGQLLTELRGKKPSIDAVVMVNYVFMGLVVALLLPIVWTASTNFPSFYYRLLAACGIIDGTLTILAVIQQRLYLQKHPELKSTIFSVTPQFDSNGQPIPVAAVEQKRRIHPLVWLLGIYIVGQVVVSLLIAALGAF
jgi:hypothetical protein